MLQSCAAFIVLVTFFLAGISSPTAAAPSRKSAPASVTEITLERVGGGPQWSGNGWPDDKIILRPSPNAVPGDSFHRLSRWLQESGFFSRKTGSGYFSGKTGDAKQPVFLGDAGYLKITAVRGGQRKWVYSYNGARDKELWQTEMNIRGTAQEMKLGTARLAWIQAHKNEPEKN